MLSRILIARALATAALLAPLLVSLPALAEPRTAAIADPDTRAWWEIAEHLSSDAMEGRDTGSPGHDRAGRWVAKRFKRAGLKPAGDNGTFFQTFPVHEARVTAAEMSVTGPDGKPTALAFLKQFTVRAADDLPARVEGPVMWAGFCRPEELTAARGKVVICLATRRAGLTTGGERIRNAQAAGAVALIQADDPGFTIEPARWPAAYARTVTLADRPPTPTGGFVVMTLDFQALGAMLAPATHPPLISDGGRVTRAPFESGARLEASFKVETRDYTATNVLALLPGSDPMLKAEHLVISAHLDGYGFGEPVGGDQLYNGTLDDAAYVGTLIRFAERRKGRGLKRSVVFAAFTGEEKGLLGARWFTAHPTVPAASLAANINLDQLRPLIPLKLMTVLAIDESSLGETVRNVAGSMDIRVQPDPEPERSMLTRADHYPFMLIGVPATGFIFGYEPGTDGERRYREWYQVRYHRPQDDIGQPMDFEAAGTFNRFFYVLAETVADAPERPRWRAGSPYAR